MTKPDFRALCAELVELDQAEPGDYANWRQNWNAAIARARALLAQPEPQGPTDEELDEFAIYWWGSETDESLVSDMIEFGSMAAYARAVLARWGRPAIEPVPVSERLPGPEDCDAEGKCWWWDEDDDDMWRLSEHRPWILCWTHWLPRWALPVPKREAEQ